MNMNQAQWHLMLVHVPVILVPTAFLILLVGYWRASESARTIALNLFCFAALIAVPAFLLGEGAEEVIEHQRGISERLIERHEESAELALWLTVALGALSAAALTLPRSLLRVRAMLLPIVGLLALSASISLGIVAHRGGEIHHPEIRSEAPQHASGEQAQ